MAGEDAIQTDAPQQGEESTAAAQQATERPKSARELQIEAIRAKRNEQFEEESGVKLAPPDPAKEPAADAEPTEGGEPASEPAKEDLSVASQLGKQLADGFIELSPEDLKRVKVRVKVDGEETTVDATKALGQFQKGAAAEVRLERATQAQREAERLLAEAQARAAAATTPAEKREAKQDAAAAEKELEAARQEFVDALYGGDTQKAVELFSKTVNAEIERALAGRAPSATLDTEQVARRAAELAVPTLKQVTSRESALTQLKSDYPDIFNDADYAFLTDRRINALIAEGKSEHDAIRDAGEEIAKKFGLKKTESERTTQPAASTTRSEKLAAKKAGLDEPEATAARAASTVAPPKTASDVIAQMRQARGQL